MAEHVGDGGLWKTQRVLAHAHWDEEAVCDACQAYVAENLGSDDGVLIVDETGFLKKGRHSAGVARQYSGTAGRIENCQIGVFLAYAGGKGRALVDRALYLPREWENDPERRRAAKIPEDLAFAAKPEMARRMIARALDGGLSCAWVPGDALYGSDKRLRMMLESREQPYLLAVRGNETVNIIDFDDRFRTAKAEDLAALAPEEGWKRLSAGAGTKGHRLRLAPPAPVPPAAATLGPLAADPPQPEGPWRQGLLRRLRPGRRLLGRLGPGGWAPLGRRGVLRNSQAGNRSGRLRDAELAGVASPCHPVHAGLGLPRRSAVAAQRSKRSGRRSPIVAVALSVAEVRRLIVHLQAQCPPSMSRMLAWSAWRRAHQANVQACHWGA